MDLLKHPCAHGHGTKQSLDGSHGRSLANILVGPAFFVFLLSSSSASAQTVQDPQEVTHDAHHDVSPPLLDILPLTDRRPAREIPLRLVTQAGPLANRPDTVFHSTA